MLYEIGEDPAVCELSLSAIKFQEILEKGCDTELLRRQLDRHNALYAGFIGKQVVVRGNVDLPHVNDVASVWEDGLTLTYNGLCLNTKITKNGVDTRVAHAFVCDAYRDDGQHYIIQPTAGIESMLVFPGVASTEYLEKIYDVLGSEAYDNNPLAFQIDEIVVSCCDDTAQLLHELGQLDYSKLSAIGTKAYLSVADHLTNRIGSSLAPCYLQNVPMLYERNGTQNVTATDDDCLFVPEYFEFMSSHGDEDRVPLLALAGVFSSRSANVYNHSVRIPLQDIEGAQFIRSTS